MNSNPAWKVALIVLGILVSAIYAIPNFYPDEPAIQISGASASLEITDGVAAQAEAAIKAANLPFKPHERVGSSALIRIGDEDAQIRAREVVQAALGRDFVVTYNLAPTTPDWLAALRAGPMKLGLDLRGGVHFLMQVDIERAVAVREESWVDELRSTLREKMPDGLRHRSVRRQAEGGIEVRFDSVEAMAAGQDVIVGATNEFAIVAEETAEGGRLLLKLTEAAIKEIRNYAIEQNRTSISKRVNELGVAEPLVQRQGEDRIVVQLPGVQDAATAKRVIGRTASLEFRLVAERDSSGVSLDAPPPGTEVYPFKDNRQAPVLVKRDKITTGESVIGAQSGYDPQTSVPEVNITLDSKGGKSMQRVTADNVGKPMAVLFVETRSSARVVTKEDGTQETVIDKEELRYVINQATIRDVLGTRFRITGLDSPAEAAELALLLRAGALAAPMYFVEERTIGPSLGKANIAAGLNASLVGLALVVFFMLVFYRTFGVIGVFALGCNLMLLTAVLGVVGATLTLPGIAGIVLTMGMAVDANVLINERIKEELNKGSPVQQAIEAGYDRAWSTIIDSNITTLIVALILFGLGSGSVKGFAITLSIGILTSMYTAVVITRLLVNALYGGKPLKALPIQPLWSRA
jgi:preprotein translocase subunit SecD